MDFTFYIKNLALFLLCGLCYEFISVYSDYKTLVGEKKMFKALNNKIFKKLPRLISAVMKILYSMTSINEHLKF